MAKILITRWIVKQDYQRAYPDLTPRQLIQVILEDAGLEVIEVEYEGEMHLNPILTARQYQVRIKYSPAGLAGRQEI